MWLNLLLRLLFLCVFLLLFVFGVDSYVKVYEFSERWGQPLIAIYIFGFIEQCEHAIRYRLLAVIHSTATLLWRRFRPNVTMIMSQMEKAFVWMGNVGNWFPSNSWFNLRWRPNKLKVHRTKKKEALNEFDNIDFIRWSIITISLNFHTNFILQQIQIHYIYDDCNKCIKSLHLEFVCVYCLEICHEWQE